MSRLETIGLVAVEKTAYHFDRLFSYTIPDCYKEMAQVGCRVSVPFGRANTYRQGMLMELTQGDGTQLKAIDALLDVSPVLSQEMLLVVKRLVYTCFCTYYEAIRTVLPGGLHYTIEKTYDFFPERHTESGKKEEEERFFRKLTAAKSAQERNAIISYELKQGQADLVDSYLKQGILQVKSNPKRRLGDKTISMVRPSPQIEESEIELLPAKQKKVMEFVREIGRSSKKEISYFCGVTDAVIQALLKKKFLLSYKEEVLRNPYQNVRATTSPASLTLTPAQDQVFSGILRQYQSQKPSVGLLHGVTGSGKTQIYIKLIEKVLQEGKQSILLVPEISLTPQLIHIFQSYFGNIVAVLHSGLSMGEQLDEYKRIHSQDAKIAIGTRSAVFAPFSHLGLIILDEEGEGSYKSSDLSPRYHARDIAKFRCFQQNAMLLLSSATPSLESYYAAQTGKYTLYELSERYKDANLPQVSVVDMRKEPTSLVSGISEFLAEELLRNLQKKEQSILLLNRRGYQTAAVCVTCGWVAECPHCSVAMTYHKQNGRLMCHYCGYSQEELKQCPNCSDTHILYQGYGTQQVQEQLNHYFPDARILRMDADTIFTRQDMENHIDHFAKGDYDILVGTQMVAKGLHFPDVTLVGVLSADSMLYSGDFKSREKVFSMLTQVVGRSGRGDKMGRAVIQTFHPEDPVIVQASYQDYRGFYQNEKIEREAFFYPPFCDICVVGFRGKIEKEVHKAANFFLEEFKRKAKEEDSARLPLIVFGITKPYVYKRNNQFQLRMLLKCKNNVAFRTFMRESAQTILKEKPFHNIHVFIDVNGEID